MGPGSQSRSADERRRHPGPIPHLSRISLALIRTTATRLMPALPPDDDADHVWRWQIFVLDRRTRRGAVFRREQAALFGQDHPAIAPPVGQHALIIDEVVA